MTDLKQMSIGELEAYAITQTTGKFYGAVKELARRLREQEKMLELGPVAALIERTKQAESALLTYQAQVGELREALEGLYSLHTGEHGPDDYENAKTKMLKKAEQVLSHSTGSKIVVNSEALDWLLRNFRHMINGAIKLARLDGHPAYSDCPEHLRKRLEGK